MFGDLTFSLPKSECPDIRISGYPGFISLPVSSCELKMDNKFEVTICFCVPIKAHIRVYCGLLPYSICTMDYDIRTCLK